MKVVSKILKKSMSIGKDDLSCCFSFFSSDPTTRYDLLCLKILTDGLEKRLTKPFKTWTNSKLRLPRKSFDNQKLFRLHWKQYH